MKTIIAVSVIALGAATSLQGASAAPAKNRDAAPGLASQHEDFSAAKKKKRTHVDVYPAEYGYRYYYPQAFAPGDPSWQSPELVRRRAIGECVIDLGYGRYESCDSAGRGGR